MKLASVLIVAVSGLVLTGCAEYDYGPPPPPLYVPPPPERPAPPPYYSPAPTAAPQR